MVTDMAKTVLITGASSGIGKEAALLFHKKGWNVVATMRNPHGRETDLHGIKNIDLAHIDVTDVNSIKETVEYVRSRYRNIDVLVNNAGYALVGPFEESESEQVRKQFDTNVFGLFDVTRELIPVFRKQGGGTIINVASIGGRVTFPLYSLYHGTKWAVEGFSESLHFELRPFNIRVKIIEPGPINTDFYNRSMSFTSKEEPSEYADFVDKAMKTMNDFGKRGSKPQVVAETIYKAACDNSWRLRYPTGANAGLILALRKVLPDRLFNGLVKAAVLK